MKEADRKLRDELVRGVIVEGIKVVKVRRNTVDTPCASCPDYIPFGQPFARVLYEDDRGREHFHFSCFRWEFTND